MSDQITLGNILSLIVFVASSVGVYVTMDRRITRAEADIQNLRANYAKFEADVIARLDKLSDKLDRLIDRNLK